jgi:hypothetical protein
VGLATLAIAAQAGGQQQAASAVRVAALIDRLNDDSFSRRQAAESELLHAGLQADAQLQRALASSSPEVRQRAWNVLRRRRSLAVWQPTTLCFPEGTASFDELLLSLSQLSASQGGNDAATYRPVSSELESTRVKLPQGELPLLQALALVCDKLQCRLEPPFPAPGGTSAVQRLVALDPRPQVAGRAFSGPLMLELLTATQALDSRELILDFRLSWEAKFQLVSHSGLPQRVEVCPAANSDRTTLDLPIEWHTTGPNAKPIRATVAIPLEELVDGLSQVKVTWPLSAAAVSNTLVIRRASAGQRLITPDAELMIERWTDQEAIVCVENLRSWPDPPEALLRSYHWTLDGKTPIGVGQCRLSETGGRWQLPASWGESLQRLHLEYRAEFARKDVEFTFDNLDVQVP